MMVGFEGEEPRRSDTDREGFPWCTPRPFPPQTHTKQLPPDREAGTSTS